MEKAWRHSHCTIFVVIYQLFHHAIYLMYAMLQTHTFTWDICIYILILKSWENKNRNPSHSKISWKYMRSDWDSRQDAVKKYQIFVPSSRSSKEHLQILSDIATPDSNSTNVCIIDYVSGIEFNILCCFVLLHFMLHHNVVRKTLLLLHEI